MRVSILVQEARLQVNVIILSNHIIILSLSGQYHSLSFHHQYMIFFLAKIPNSFFNISFCIFSQNFCSHFRLWCGTCRDAVSYLISFFSFMQPIVSYLISSLHFMQAIIQFKVDQAVSEKVCMHLDGPHQHQCLSCTKKLMHSLKRQQFFSEAGLFLKVMQLFFLRYRTYDLQIFGLKNLFQIGESPFAILVCGPIVQYSIHLLRTFGLRLLPLSIMLMQRFVQGLLLPWNEIEKARNHARSTSQVSLIFSCIIQLLWPKIPATYSTQICSHTHHTYVCGRKIMDTPAMLQRCASDIKFWL